MKRKYVLYCVLSLLALLIGLKFLSTNQSENVTSSFSLVTTNPTNFIDIGKLVISDYEHISREGYSAVYVTKNNSLKQVYFNDRQLRSLELSPSLRQAAFSYYPDEPLDQELSLALFDLESGEVKEIFHTSFPSWDITSDVHWLGNKHLFFLRHCGTACQGITLLNIHTVETANAVLSYPSFPDQPATTYFRDWSGQEYEMNGLVSQVTSQTIDNNHYLVFVLQDGVGNDLGEKRVLFSDSEEATLSSAKL